MIGLIALAIAFLTLLAPSPPSAQDKAPQTSPPVATVNDPATWAGPDDVIRPLLGAWRTTVTFPDGTTEETELEVARSPEGTGASSANVSFGPATECYTGPLTAHRDGADVVFASQIECRAAAFGTAALTGRWSRGVLEGTAYLAEGERLVTWRAERPS